MQRVLHCQENLLGNHVEHILQARKCCNSVFDVFLFFQEITGQTEQEQKYLERVEEEDFGQGTIGRVRIFMRMVVLVMVIIMMGIIGRTTAKVRVIWMSTCPNTCEDAGMNSIEYFVVGQCSAQNWFSYVDMDNESGQGCNLPVERVTKNTA